MANGSLLVHFPQGARLGGAGRFPQGGSGTREAVPSLALLLVMMLIPSSTTPLDYYRRQRALASGSDPALIDRTFEYALSDAVRNQDAPALLALLLGNPAADDRVWDAIKRRWPDVTRKTNISRGALRIVRSLALCDEDAARDIRAFFAAHLAAGADRGVTRTVESVRACAATRQRQQPRLAAALTRP